jgi:acetolactate synthase-1/2/3 large subunit
MSAGDLATVARVGGPTILLLFRNSSYGWIKALQKLYHGGRYFSVDFTESLSYMEVAEGFGLQSTQVEEIELLVPALQEALSSGEPCFVEMVTAGEEEAIPPVAPWQRCVEEGQACDEN